jgi:hypothetical protein
VVEPVALPVFFIVAVTVIVSPGSTVVLLTVTFVTAKAGVGT